MSQNVNGIRVLTQDELTSVAGGNAYVVVTVVTVAVTAYTTACNELVQLGESVGKALYNATH